MLFVLVRFVVVNAVAPEAYSILGTTLRASREPQTSRSASDYVLGYFFPEQPPVEAESTIART